MTRTDDAAYEWHIDQMLREPRDTLEGLANRLVYAERAKRDAPSPGKSHFARTQYRADWKAFQTLVRSDRPRWRSPMIVAVTAPPVVLFGVLIAGWIMK